MTVKRTKQGSPSLRRVGGILAAVTFSFNPHKIPTTAVKTRASARVSTPVRGTTIMFGTVQRQHNTAHSRW